MGDPYSEIIAYLKKSGVDFDLEEHAPVITSAEAAEVRGRPLSEGMKSLVVKVGDQFVLAVVPGDCKLASNKLRRLRGARQTRFATPEEVESLMGCKIGACYPVGPVCGLDVYADTKFTRNAEVAFNPGVHDQTIVMKWADFTDVVKPKIADITQ